MDSVATSWYYAGQPGATAVGPVTFEQLRSLVREGAITKSQMVSNGDASRWIPAALVPGLFLPFPDEPTNAPESVVVPNATDNIPAHDSWNGIRTAVPSAIRHFIVCVRLGVAHGAKHLASRRLAEALTILGRKLHQERMGDNSALAALDELKQKIDQVPAADQSGAQRFRKRYDRHCRDLGTAQFQNAACHERCREEFGAAKVANQQEQAQIEWIAGLKQKIHLSHSRQRRQLLTGYGIVGTALVALCATGIEIATQTTDVRHGPAVSQTNIPSSLSPVTPALPSSAMPTSSQPSGGRSRSTLGPADFRQDELGNVISPATHDSQGNLYPLARLGWTNDHCMLCGRHRSYAEREKYSDRSGFGFCETCGTAADAWYLTRRGRETGVVAGLEVEQAGRSYAELVGQRYPLYGMAFLTWRDEEHWREMWNALSVLTAGPSASR